MASSIARVDLETFSDFQNELHLPKEADELICSHILRDFKKCTWHSHVPSQMSAIPSGDTVRFPCLGSFHNLLYSYRKQNIPCIRVKPDFQDRIEICWTKNLGTNTIKEAKLLFNEEPNFSFDNITLDDYFRPGMFMVNGQSKFVDKHQIDSWLGNTPEMTNFSDILPEYDLFVPDPWYYSKDGSLAIPLYLCNNIPVSHTYILRNKITDLLRMREKTGETWKEIPCNLKYLDGVGEGILPIPELWGRYDLLDEDELNYNRNFWKTEKGEYNPKSEKSFYYNDYIKVASMSSAKLGENIYVDLESSLPVRSLTWKAENLTSSKNRNYSNYTTDPDGNGRTPIHTINYKYSNSDRIPETNGNHFETMEHFFHSQNISETGYGMYSYSIDPGSLDSDIGIVLSGKDKGSMKARLTVFLKDTDPYRAFKDEPEENTSQFKLHVRMTVNRKLSFKYIKDSTPYSYTVEIK